MKKILSVLILLAMVFSFASCTEKPKGIEIDLAKVKAEITDKVELSDPMDIDAEALSDLYDIDAEDVLECEALVTMDGTFPDEAIMVKAKDDDAKQRIVDSFNSRLEDVKVQSENYDEDNFKLASECHVLISGDYVALFVSAHHAQMEQIFNSNVVEK